METIEVYSLAAELERDPDQVAQTQALTLDTSRPNMGLKGTEGLFGSPQWWESIRSGAIPSIQRSGVIQRVYTVGQDPTEMPNEIEVLCSDGQQLKEGIYVNSERDIVHYQVGKRIDIRYALDELKALQPSGQKNYLEVVLEVSVDR